MPQKFSRKSLSIFLVVIAVIFLLIFFNLRGWLAAPKDMVYFVGSPFLKFFQQTGDRIYGLFNYLTTIKDLSRENYFLSNENKALLAENSSLKEKERENELLRQRLGLGEATSQQTVLARIAGYNSQLGQYFLIDKGVADGLSLNLAAVTANNFLVGVISEVGQHSARVTLISDSNSLVNAITQETRIHGVVRGSHGLALNLEMIPADQRINQGELVLSSGLNDLFPQNLIIGWVQDVIVKESKIFQQAILRPAADFLKLESVFVIINK